MSGWNVLTCSSMLMPMLSKFGADDMFNPTFTNLTQYSGNFHK